MGGEICLDMYNKILHDRGRRRVRWLGGTTKRKNPPNMKQLTIAVGAMALVCSASLFANGPMPSDTPTPRERFVHNRIKHLHDKRHTDAVFHRLDSNASWLGIPSYEPSGPSQRQRLIDEVELLALIKERQGGHLGPKQRARMDADLHKLGYK